jgi:hypothetical protein
MNGRLSKEARALEAARWAICDFHSEVGNIRKAIASLRERHLAEPHHIALDASVATMGEALEAWHRAEGVSVAEFNRRSGSLQ